MECVHVRTYFGSLLCRMKNFNKKYSRLCLSNYYIFLNHIYYIFPINTLSWGPYLRTRNLPIASKGAAKNTLASNNSIKMQ